MGQARVLIVDDDRRLRSQLYTRLLDIDVFSDGVANASEAIEYLRDRHYGVVLLDIDLLNHEAYSVIDSIRAMSGADRPIILATAVRESSASLDADLVQIVIRKPLRLADVAEMIRSCVYGGSDRKRVAGVDESGDAPLQVVGA